MEIAVTKAVAVAVAILAEPIRAPVATTAG